MVKRFTHYTIWYFLNPMLWFRLLGSYLMTFCLLFNRFFALFFSFLIAIFILLFLYDRYLAFTYGEDSEVSAYKVTLFSRTTRYDSPLSSKRNAVGRELSHSYEEKVAQESQSDTGNARYRRPNSSIQREVRRRMKKSDTSN